MNDLEKKFPEEPLNPAAADNAEETIADTVTVNSNCTTEDICETTSSPAEDLSEVSDNFGEVSDVAISQNLSVDDVDLEEPRRINYHVMTKDELVSALREILSENRMDAHKEVSVIKQAFFNIRSKETLEEVNEFVENGGNPQEFSSQADASEAEFKELYSEFKTKRATYLEAQEIERKENLAKKQAVLNEMKSISEDIDNVNTRFQEFQELQQAFKSVNDIPATAETEIWKDFQVTVEQFYDHLKMNKELRDLDFKKNLEAKKNLIVEARNLETMTDPVSAFRMLQSLHDEWRNIGPVAKELREEIWTEFKDASTIINKRHQEFFEKRKADELANEEAKTALCVELESMDLSAINTFNAWTEATEKVIDLQKKWKEFGFASKKINNALYSRFRQACDAFFAAKTEYFQKTKDEFAANLAKKVALCEKVESMKETDDIHKATNEVIKLQAEWKKIGSVARKNSDEIWLRFQTACNYFFDERKKINASKRNEESANLSAKQQIISQLKELPLDGVRAEVLGKVKDLQAEWQNIGFVPYKVKDKLYGEYREICDTLYNTYNSRENKQRISNFRERVSSLKGNGLDKERDKLVRALEGRKNDLKTIENNLGFFNIKSSAGNSLLRDMENKIKKLKEEISQIEEKISILDAR